MAGGRPPKFKEEYIEQVGKLCKLGATDKEMADFFQVSEVTFNKWKFENEKFMKSIKLNKAVADERIERRLFEKAMGYTHESEEIKVVGNEIERIKTVKHYPPDTTAAIFWLKNRKAKEWRDKQEQQIDLNLPANVKIEIIKSDDDNDE